MCEGEVATSSASSVSVYEVAPCVVLEEIGRNNKYVYVRKNL